MAARILFFESDPKFARAVRDRLVARGARVEVVEDGNAGLERASAERPDLILLTIELPQMNGFLVCKKLKKNTETANIPVVILSSEATEEIFDQHRKLRTRAEEYLRKPIEPTELIDKISGLVQLAAADEAIEAVELDEVEEVRSSAKPAAPVDDEIDQFADSAFDALVMGEESAGATSIAAVPPDMQRALEAPPQAVAPAPPRPASVRPPPPPPRSAPPPPAHLDALEFEKTKGELQKEKSRADEVSQQFDRQKAEVGRLEKEIADLKGKATKGGGISSREFLDLREALNSKDKEILDLRDQVSARDKQLLEAREKNLGLERGRADFEDQILALERAKADLDDTLEALRADKESITKRADDLKGRVERTEEKVKKLEGDLEKEKGGRAADVERLTKERDDRVAAAERTKEEALAGKNAAHAAALEDLEQSHNAALSAAKGEHEQALEERGAAHARELDEAKRGHEEALATARAQAAASKVEALTQLRNELTRERDEATSKAAAAAAEALEAQKSELETSHAAEVKKLNQAQSQELAVLGRKMAEGETKLAAAEDRIKNLDEARQRLEDEVAGSHRELEEVKAALASARAENEAITAIKEQQSQRISTLENAERNLSSRLGAAEGKIRGDEELLERARRAFAIGLSLLEDQRGNGSG